MPESNDKLYEQAMNDIFAIYEQAEKDMLEKVSKRVAKGIKEEGWNEAKLKETQELNKELATLMSKANKAGQKKIAVEVAKGYLKGKHITYKETAEIIKQEGFKIGNGKVSGNTWGKAGYFTDNDEVLDFYGGLMTQKKNKGKETEVIEQYIKVGKTKNIVLNYSEDKHAEAFYGTKDKDMMYIEAAKQLDGDAKKFFFENLKGIEKGIKWHILYDKETGENVKTVLGEPSSSTKEKYIVKPDYFTGGTVNEVKKLFNNTIKKYKYDTLQIESNNSYVGYSQTVVLNSKSLVNKEEAEKVVEEVLEKMSYEQLLEEAPIPMNLKQLVKATNGLIENASFQVLRSANDAYQKVMANATTGLLAGVDTRRQVSQKMLNEFAAKGITSFVDKAGRNWNLSSYAEMCARTVSQNAARQGHFDRQLEVGEDLVKVSTIGTTCPICQRWQGVVLSISGNHPVYHSVEEAKASGLFHPNCKHTFNMYIPDLDEGTEFQGKVEPDDYNEATPSSQLYYETQKQRSNERHIRYWKKRRALAITPEEEAKANENIKKWQYKNLIHCEKHGLRRNYAREGVMSGNATGPQGPLTGGSLKEYEEVFKGVIGGNPKPLYKMNLQFFAQKSYDKWLKDEIASLDELDVDKAMLKDANNKNVTPTSLYKKYIGDNPGQEYAEVSEYEKGTKEYKSGYAKWLKQQIEEIGVTYKVKPKYVEVHEDIPEEDKSLSATNIYKKYHDGKAPTEAYKEAGGEAGTGMKYGKWVETQKKELIKNGITKTVPFGNATTQKTVDVITKATQTITDAKLLAYKAELDKTVTGAYTGSQAVKKAAQEMKDAQYDGTPDEYDHAAKKYEIAKEKHLEMVKKKAQKAYGTSDFAKEKQELLDKLLDIAGDSSKADMHAHIDNQYKMYEEVEAEKKAEAKAAEKLKKIQEAELKKKIAENGGLLPDDKVIEACINQKDNYSQPELVKELRADMKKALKQMGLSSPVTGKHGSCYFDIHDYYGTADKQKAIDGMTPWKAIGDYTSGSRPHNFAFKENKSAKNYFNGARYTREQAQQIDKVLDKAFEVPSAMLKKNVVVRHGNDEDGLVGLLGDDLDFENYSHSMFVNRLKELNQKTQMGEKVILNETGYLSTSPSNSGGFTDKRVEVRILLPTGTKGLYVDDFSYYSNEEELLLKRNQKFKFVRAYSKDIDSDEFEKVRGQMSGSGTRTWSGTSSIIFLQAIPD